MALAIDVALVTKRVVSYCRRILRQCCIRHSFQSKSHLTNCTLLIRWSTSVLKVGVPCDREAYKDTLACSVTVRIPALPALSLKYLSIEWVKPKN